MDQVDEIIIMSLRRIGVPLEDESINKIQQFDSDTIVQSVVMCLALIDPELEGKYPQKLPESMSLRFRLCSDIAERIKELGFKSEIGYQTLLYPNEMELRRLFMFLVENLPRDQLDTSAASAGEHHDPVTRLKLQLASVLSKQLQESWKPHYLSTRDRMSQRSFRSFYNAQQDSVDVEKVPKQGFVPSVVELSSVWMEKQSIRNVNKASGDAMRAKIEELEREMKEQEQLNLLSAMDKLRNISVDDSIGKSPRGLQLDDSEAEAQRSAELSELQEESNALTNKYSDALRKIESCIAKTKATTERIEELSADLKTKESMYKSMKKTYDLLPTAQESIGKLEAFLESAEERMTNLQTQFNSHHDPLVAERDELKAQLDKEDTPAQRMRKEIEGLEGKLQSLSDVNKEKEEAIRILTPEVKNVDESRSRQVFTDKIFDIIAQIHKQKLEIDKIKVENYDLMRDVVSLNGKLDRAFHVTDEIIFKDATKDETARKCYKLLATLHENCQALLSGIDETASLNREIRELEDQIDLESKKKTVKNLEKIKQDLQQVREEKRERVKMQQTDSNRSPKAKKRSDKSSTQKSDVPEVKDTNDEATTEVKIEEQPANPSGDVEQSSNDAPVAATRYLDPLAAVSLS